MLEWAFYFRETKEHNIFLDTCVKIEIKIVGYVFWRYYLNFGSLLRLYIYIYMHGQIHHKITNLKIIGYIWAYTNKILSTLKVLYKIKGNMLIKLGKRVSIYWYVFCRTNVKQIQYFTNLRYKAFIQVICCEVNCKSTKL